MAKYRIEINREECIGCGSCVAVCEKSFEIGNDGKASLKGKKEVDNFGCNMEAAETCPVNVIHIFDLKTKKKLI